MVAGRPVLLVQGAAAEESCLAALRRGDVREAVGALMNLYGRSIYGYCRHLLGDVDLARDVLQITFLQAQQDLSRFAGRSSIKVWLYGIARHRCLDALKSARRRERRFTAIEEEHSGSAVVAPDEADLLAGEMKQVLARCLHLLEARSRAAVLLRYQEDMSYPEMASVCEERVSTLQKRVARALPVLRQCIEARMTAS
jgi:RNA polymerase sigma-70 factor (ECF subfamily)